MNTRLLTHAAPASFDSGVGDSRLATIAKITRSTCTGSTRRADSPAATRRIAAPIPNRDHS